ncbi:hypothetical protein EV714DRAFT_234075 [Schizophyllum commune]
MGRLSQEERLLLDALIKENGADKVKDYISRTFTPTVIKIRRITPENAHEWIDLSAFAAWLVDDCQQRLRGSTPPRDPAPPVEEQQRPPDVQQPRPTEVQQPRNPEVQQSRPSVDEMRETTPPRDPAPPDVEQQRPPDVQQPRPTEVQQPRTPEVQQPRPSVGEVRQPRPTEVQSTASPPFPPPSTNRPLQKRVRLLDLEDIAAHPDSDDPLATGPSDARNRKRRHTCFFDEEGSAQASGSNRIVGLSPFTGHSGSSQDTDRPFDVPCSYCKERGIPCMPQKDVYRAMACLQCSYVRVHCSHVPPSRSGKPANRYFFCPLLYRAAD